MTDNKKLIDYFFVIGVFLFGLYYYCFRILGFDLSQTPGDFGDSRFINYILEHGFKWLNGEDPDFWTANFMYPLKSNVTISDSMAGALPIYAMFRFTGFGTETAYQLWWLSAGILNFWCCFYAFRRIGFRYGLCAIGAYVFAFGINNFNQFAHLQFYYKFLIPLAAAMLYVFLNKGLARHFIGFVLCFVLQFYASAYLGVMLFYFSLFFTCFYLLIRPNRQRFLSVINKKLLLQCLITVIAGCLALLVVAVPYHVMAEAMGYRVYDVEMVPYLPRVYSYFFVNQSSLTWDFLKDSPLKNGNAWYLHDMFPGLFCYIGLAATFIYVIRAAIKKEKLNYLPLVLFSLCILCVLLFSKTESGFSLFKYFRVLPGMESMRLTSRFMILETFFLIWLTLFFIDYLFKRGSVALYSIIILIAITDNLFDTAQLPITKKEDRNKRLEDMSRLISFKNRERKKIIAVISTGPQEDVVMQIDAMLATQKMGIYTLNGYSSTCYGDLCGAYNDTTHVKLSQWLRTNNIEEKRVQFIIH